MTQYLHVSPTTFASFADKAEPLKGPLAGQIATRLAAGDMTSFFGLLPNPDPVLRTMGKSISAYRNLLIDPLVMAARSRRMAAVVAMERGFHPDKSRNTPERVLKACDAMLSNLDVHRLVCDFMDGAFFGYRVSEVMWGRGPAGIFPLDVIAKPCEWFAFEPENSKLRFKSLGSMTSVAVPERKFIVVGKARSWDNPYGESDLAACFWPVTFKRAGFKFWMTFTEKYGMPWAVGKLPRTATQTEHDDLADKLEAMVRDAVATVPDDSSVELLNMKGDFNADLYERLMMFCRSEISIALLGNNQSVEAQSNLASAQAAHKVEAWLRDADAEMVSAGFNQLAKMFCEVNFPGVVPPKFHFWEQDEINISRAERDEKLAKSGANFTKEYWMRTYRLQEGDIR